ncbi:MAG: uridine kinase [Lachnospiraceae bacterium]|nr:uridine kinase [Lachnospiraceae bacterium]
MNNRKPLIIAIDGMAAAGKTTAALNLQREIANESGFVTQEEIEQKIKIIHMDDFFLPMELRTEARLSEAGGNVHYERFMEEVVAKLQNTVGFEYRIFDCRVMDYAGTVKVDASAEVIIIEGAYSMHPYFGKYYDKSFFYETSPETQKERILQRNGAKQWEMFCSRWIPMEMRYFEAYGIEEKCDSIVKN